MGVLQRFERRLEDLVGGTFARLFKGQVEPVEIAKALQREADENRAIVGGGQVLVPNRYVVELGPSDHARLAPWESQLTRTLAEMVQEFLAEEGWTTYGAVTVAFALDRSLRTGMFRVGSDVDTGGPPPWAGRGEPPPPWPAQPPYQPQPPPYQQPPYQPQYQQPSHTQQYEQPPLYEPPRPQPVLIINGTDRRYPVSPGTTLIGRGQDADLRLPDTGVSRRHAVIRYDGATAVVEDLNSTNGTVVNGQRIRTWRLQSDDVITVGHTVIVFRQEQR